MISVHCENRATNLWTGLAQSDNHPIVSSATCVPSSGGWTILLAVASRVRAPTVTIDGETFHVQAVCGDFNLAVLVGKKAFPAQKLAERTALKFPATMANGVTLTGYKDGRYLVSGSGDPGSPVLNLNGELVGIWDDAGGNDNGTHGNDRLGRGNDNGTHGNDRMGGDGRVGNDRTGRGVIPIAFWRSLSGVVPASLRPSPLIAHVPELGCCLQPLTESMQRVVKSETGNMVTFVLPGSAAARAGLVPKDVILGLKVNGQGYAMDEDGHFSGVPWTPDAVPLADLMRWLPLNKRARVDLVVAKFSGGGHRTVSVSPDDSMRKGSRRHVMVGIEPWETITFQGATFAMLRKNLEEDADGKELPDNLYALFLTELHNVEDKVVVTDVAPGSPADADGVEPGFMVDRLNNSRVTTLRDLSPLSAPESSGLIEFSHLGRHRVFAFFQSLPKESA